MSEVVEVYLTRDMVALVSSTDYHLVANLKWRANKANDTKFYAARTLPKQLRPDGTIKRSILYMHRLIANVTAKEIIVDHFNGNGLDCTRDNLIVSEATWNTHNRENEIGEAGYRGVSRDRGRYRARIRRHGEEIYIGCYATPEEAAIAYDAKALALFGPLAMTNLRLGHIDRTFRQVKVFAPAEALADIPWGHDD